MATILAHREYSQFPYFLVEVVQLLVVHLLMRARGVGSEGMPPGRELYERMAGQHHRLRAQTNQASETRQGIQPASEQRIGPLERVGGE